MLSTSKFFSACKVLITLLVHEILQYMFHFKQIMHL